MTGTHPRRNQDIIIPPKPPTPNDLAVQPETQKQTRQNSQRHTNRDYRCAETRRRRHQGAGRIRCLPVYFLHDMGMGKKKVNVARKGGRGIEMKCHLYSTRGPSPFCFLRLPGNRRTNGFNDQRHFCRA